MSVTGAAGKASRSGHRGAGAGRGPRVEAPGVTSGPLGGHLAQPVPRPHAPGVEAAIGNLPTLVLLVLATEGFLTVWQQILFGGWEIANLLGLTSSWVGAEDPVVLGLLLLASTLAFAAWGVFVVRWGLRLFSGARAARYRRVTEILVAAGCIWFLWTLYSFVTVASQPAERIGP